MNCDDKGTKLWRVIMKAVDAVEAKPVRPIVVVKQATVDRKMLRE
jgi:hypothetical protein